MTRLSDFTADRLDGTPQNLSAYAGKVALVVNVASKCGMTPQYEGLEALWRHYRERGFVVLGFPCNQFGGQEPGSAGEIAAFCEQNYQVSFPMFAKIEVNGPGTHPIYKWMKRAGRGFLGFNDIKWNFTKFLIGRDGRVMRRFASSTKPEDLAPEIERAL